MNTKYKIKNELSKEKRGRGNKKTDENKFLLCE